MLNKQFYHCFGCGAHGTAIGFLMEHAGRSFPDAVEDLAREVGLDVPRTERAGEKERREEAADLNELLLTAARFYRSRLEDAPAASPRFPSARPSSSTTASVAARTAPPSAS